MGGCPNVISPIESPECCVDGGVLEPQVLLVHHIFGSSRDNHSNGRLEKQSTVPLNEWSASLHDCMIGVS